MLFELIVFIDRRFDLGFGLHLGSRRNILLLYIQLTLFILLIFIHIDIFLGLRLLHKILILIIMFIVLIDELVFFTISLLLELILHHLLIRHLLTPFMFGVRSGILLLDICVLGLGIDVLSLGVVRFILYVHFMSGFFVFLLI